MVEFSYDRDDLFDRDPRGLFERPDMRQDERDRDAEFRRAMEELERERQENARALDAAAKARFEAALIPLTAEDLRRIVNDANVRVTPEGTISSRRPSGRDTIRRSGQFSRAALLPRPKKPRKKNRKHCKNLSMCFREANRKLRKANGQLRKGKTQADVARMAHRLMKKC